MTLEEALRTGRGIASQEVGGRRIDIVRRSMVDVYLYVRGGPKPYQKYFRVTGAACYFAAQRFGTQADKWQPEATLPKECYTL